jgi:hypothetical protein
MNRKEEFQEFTGDSLSEGQFDLDFEAWSNMKDVLARQRGRKRIRQFEERLLRKGATALRSEIIKDLFERLRHRKSAKPAERLSEESRKKYACFLKEMSNGR